DEACPGLGSDGYRAPDQLGGETSLAGPGCHAAQPVEQGVLRDAVVDPLGDPQGLRVETLCLLEIARDQRRAARVQQHHFKAVEITNLTTETDAFCRRRF